MSAPDKLRVAQAFSRAAHSYDSVADLQRRVGEQVLQQLPPMQPQTWVDIGCGTGYFSQRLREQFPAAFGVSLDIAEGMLQHSRTLGRAEHCIAADAEHLPLRAESADLLFSSLAVQWCPQIEQVLDGAWRALKPGGRLAVTTLCDGTLFELRDSWQQVDDNVHVNRFRQEADYQQAIAQKPWQIECWHSEPVCEYFADLPSLTHSLRALGAQNKNPGRPDGLSSRERIRRLAAAYETLRQPQGLPATYQVLYWVLRKP